jgi:hypothetical protein
VTLLDRVAALLEAEAIPHAVIGGAALASAGIARSTFDIDLLTTDDRVLIDSLWRPLRPEVAIHVRPGKDDDPLAGIVRLDGARERPVDVIVGRHSWQRTAVARATRTDEGPPIVLPRDLILLKLYAGGQQDLWDIRELLALPDGETFVREVDGDLVGLPDEMRYRWAEAQRRRQ